MPPPTMMKSHMNVVTCAKFSKFIDNHSLYQKSAIRLNSSEQLTFEPKIVVTNSDFRFIVKDQLNDIGNDFQSIIIEPEAKNTAPAILVASLLAYKYNENATLLTTPCDHLISDIEDFHKAIHKGIKETYNKKIITFGIQPSRPEIGYGYLEYKKENINSVSNLIRFVEKPSFEKAVRMINTGNYLWNSGIFLFRARDMIDAFTKHAPEILTSVEESLLKSEKDLEFLRLEKQSWSSCKNISIDYAIMEKAQNLSVVPFLTGWSDLGDWNSVWQEMKSDEDGLSLSTNAYAMDCKETLLRSESENQIICGVGLNNIIGVAMPDAVLIADRNKTDLIKKIVDHSGKEISIQYDKNKPTIKTSLSLNSSKAQKYLGWNRKITLDEGIKKTIKWWKENIKY